MCTTTHAYHCACTHLGEEWEDRDAGMAAHHRHLDPVHIQPRLLSVEGLGAHLQGPKGPAKWAGEWVMGRWVICCMPKGRVRVSGCADGWVGVMLRCPREGQRWVGARVDKHVRIHARWPKCLANTGWEVGERGTCSLVGMVAHPMQCTIFRVLKPKHPLLPRMPLPLF